MFNLESTLIVTSVIRLMLILKLSSKLYTMWVYFLTSGRIQEGIRELDVLKDKRDVNICSTMALMFAHKHSQSVGKIFSLHIAQFHNS